MFNSKSKLLWALACFLLIGVYTLTLKSNFSISNNEENKEISHFEFSQNSPKTQKTITSTPYTIQEKNNEKLSKTSISTTTNLNTVVTYDWEKLAENMEDVDDSLLRCKALYVGCFVAMEIEGKKAFIDIDIGYSTMNLESSEFEDLCLDGCFKRDHRLAGVNLHKRICHCSKTFSGFISIRRKASPADSADSTRHCTSDASMHVYSRKRNCTREVTEESITDDKVACVKIPNKLTGATIALTQPNVTAKQCILNCELRSFPYAIPMSEKGICACSDSYSIFGNADDMLSAMKTECDRKSNVPVYKTVVRDTDCEPLRFFNLGQAPSTLLASFYGAGNTWTRHLIEQATGVYTGSVYNDLNLYEGGMLGGLVKDDVGRTVVVKDHLFKLQVRPHFRHGILLVRNPYDATLAEFSRRATHSHTGVADTDIFRRGGFKRFSSRQPNYWFNIAKTMLRFFNNRLLVVYFEDIVKNPVKELRRIVEFLPEGLVASEGEALERKLMCMNLDLVGKFKRPPRKLDYEPYEPNTRRHFDEKIRELDDLLIKYNQPPLPDSYLLP